MSSTLIVCPRGTTNKRRTTTNNNSSSHYHNSAPSRPQPLIFTGAEPIHPVHCPRKLPTWSWSLKTRSFSCHFGGLSSKWSMSGVSLTGGLLQDFPPSPHTQGSVASPLTCSRRNSGTLTIPQYRFMEKKNTHYHSLESLLRVAPCFPAVLFSHQRCVTVSPFSRSSLQVTISDYFYLDVHLCGFSETKKEEKGGCTVKYWVPSQRSRKRSPWGSLEGGHGMVKNTKSCLNSRRKMNKRTGHTIHRQTSP